MALREILKRAHLARGSASLTPLKLTSLVTFLFRDKKVTRLPTDSIILQIML